jgi:hypothetical protein
MGQRGIAVLKAHKTASNTVLRPGQAEAANFCFVLRGGPYGVLTYPKIPN